MESLAQTMSVEAIAAIKAKRLAMQRFGNDAISNSKRQREQDRLADEHQLAICKRAMERERRHRPMVAQLLGEKAMPGVLQTLALVFDYRKHIILHQHDDKQLQPRQQNPLAMHPSSRYDRYGQEKFLRGREDFDINPLGTNLNRQIDAAIQPDKVAGQDMVNPAGREASKATGMVIGKETVRDPRRAAGRDLGKEASKATGMVISKEIGKGTDSKDLSKAAGKALGKETSKERGRNISKESGRNISKEVGKETSKEVGKETSKESATKSRSSGSHHRSSHHRSGRHRSSHRHSTSDSNRRRSTKPIIVVPAAVTSLITLHNAKQLLQEMRYVPVEQTRKSGAQSIEEVIIERRVKGELVRYRVIDNVKRLRTEEWQKVAAVFAMGPQWQFKGWPHDGDPAPIFHEVCAFHLHFKDTAPAKELRNLEVHMLALPQHERHSDCGILKEFWEKLDRHIAMRAMQFAFMKQK